MHPNCFKRLQMIQGGPQPEILACRSVGCSNTTRAYTAHINTRVYSAHIIHNMYYRDPVYNIPVQSPSADIIKIHGTPTAFLTNFTKTV